MPDIGTDGATQLRTHNPLQNSWIWIDVFDMSKQSSCREWVVSTVRFWSLEFEFDGATQIRPAAKVYQATVFEDAKN